MELIYIVVLFVFIMLQLATLKIGGWLLPFIFGAFGLALVVGSLSQSANIPFYPYPNMLLALTSVVTMVFAVSARRGEA